nr:hypothetical protein CFP56_44408 [Quercus suber]
MIKFYGGLQTRLRTSRAMMDPSSYQHNFELLSSRFQRSSSIFCCSSRSCCSGIKFMTTCILLGKSSIFKVNGKAIPSQSSSDGPPGLPFSQKHEKCGTV